MATAQGARSDRRRSPVAALRTDGVSPAAVHARTAGADRRRRPGRPRPRVPESAPREDDLGPDVAGLEDHQSGRVRAASAAWRPVAAVQAPRAGRQQIGRRSRRGRRARSGRALLPGHRSSERVGSDRVYTAFHRGPRTPQALGGAGKLIGDGRDAACIGVFTGSTRASSAIRCSARWANQVAPGDPTEIWRWTGNERSPDTLSRGASVSSRA